MVWWLGTITPCIIIAYLVILDLACRIKPLRRLFRWIIVPFTNFLVLEDLLDPIGKSIQPPAWKRHTFVALPALEAMSWVAMFFYTLLVSDPSWLVRSGVSAILWVRIQRVFNVLLPDFDCRFQSGVAIGLTARTPSSPPYLLLLFCLEASATAIGDLYLAVSELPERIGYTVLSVFWAIIPFLLLSLLGTLPLQPILPAVNVARVGKVRNPIKGVCAMLIRVYLRSRPRMRIPILKMRRVSGNG